MPITKPIVFISSTAKDLAAHRDAAAKAARQAGFEDVRMEDFEAQSRKPPYAACMEKVRECDVLVVIVAHRYGWVPEDQPGKQAKSITWLECEEMLRQAQGKAFKRSAGLRGGSGLQVAARIKGSVPRHGGAGTRRPHARGSDRDQTQRQKTCASSKPGSNPSDSAASSRMPPP